MMEQQPSNELQVDHDSGNMFNEVSRWARFIAIVCFVCIGIGVLSLAFSSGILVQTFKPYMPELAGGEGLLIGVIIIVLILFTYITILLYRFATLVKLGLDQRDQAIFNDGLKNLKNYFVINGIFALIGIVVNVVATIGKLF